MERRMFSPGDKLVLRHYENETYIEREFVVKNILGEGASCITYFVKYKENDSYSHCGVLKEFNPVSKEIKIEKFVEGYKLQTEFSAEIKNAKNITSNTEGIYLGNNTKYILMSCNDGTSYENVQEDKLQDIIKTSIAICNAVKVYHDAGFLHLDIKPDNIFILPETREIIKLFDFDSVHKKSDLINSRLSYSVNWAAPELIYFEKNYEICEATDIYSIGAILFSKIMGRMPVDKEKERFSKFEFDKNSNMFKNISPKIFNMLTKLFRNTLQVDVSRRYQSAEELKEFLFDILEVASGKAPFLIDSRWSVSPNAIGREKELSEIHGRLKDDNTVFIRAMGGIGKSELAKMYAEKYKDKYETIQFLSFDTNLENTISNNLLFSNFKENDYIEKGKTSDESIFNAKIKLFEELDEKTLIIIDNFNVSFDKDIDRVITSKNNGYKVIFTTRNFNEDFEDKYFELRAMDEDTCLELYYKHYGNMKKHREDNVDTIKRMLKTVSYNTLLVKLMALNCKKQRIKPEIMLDKLEKSEIATIQGKINHSSDISRDEDNNKLMYEHLCTIFDMSGLKKNEKFIMMNLSLINRIKIDASRFIDWCLLEDFNDVNSLVESGWLELDVEKDMLSLHHVISDLIYEELKPDAEKCNVFISSLAEVVNPKNYNSYHERRHYLSFCRTVAKRIKGISQGAADFFSEIGKVLSTRESDREDCLKYLLRALDAYNNIYGEISVKSANVYLALAVTYKTLSSSFEMFYDENTDEEVWGKINEYNGKYISIYKELFKEDEDKIAEAYLKVGKIYKDMSMLGAVLFEKDMEEEISNKAEEYFIKFFDIKERIYKNNPNKLKESAQILYEFYSELMSPKYSEAKANFYCYEYNARPFAVYKDGEEIKPLEIEYCFEMASASKMDNDIESAIEYYKEALRCSEEEVPFYTYSNAYIEIIKLYKDEGMFDEALKYFADMNLKCEILDYSEKAEAYYLVGTIYKELNENEFAIDKFNQSINLWEEYLKFDEYSSEDYGNEKILYCRLKLGQIYESKDDYFQAEAFYLEAFKLYEKIMQNDDMIIGDILELHECLGNIYYKKQDNNKAFYYYMIEVEKLSKSYYKEENERAIIISRKVMDFLDENEEDYKEKIIKLYLSIGNAYFANDLNVKEALEYYLKGLEISIEVYGSKHYMSAKFYDRIGNIYCYKLDDCYDEGKSYLNECNYKAIAYHESEKFKEKPVEQFKIFEEAGENYARVDNYKEAICCLEKALEFINDYIECLGDGDLSYYDYIKVNNSLVRNYKEIKEYDKALKYEESSLKVIKKESYKPSNNEISEKYIDIGDLYLEKDDYEQTIAHYLLALNYYEENHDENIDNIINVYKKITNVYKITEDHDQINIYEQKIKELLGSEIEFQE